MASLPLLKLTCALPLVSGRTPVSALSGLKSVEERESDRMGGIDENEECRYESSAGEKGRVVLAAGGILALILDRQEMDRKVCYASRLCI